MLERCGAATLDDLFSDIPGELRLRSPSGTAKRKRVATPF